MRHQIKQINPYYCQECGANLRGKAIPKKERHLYGATHYGREVGCFYNDRTMEFQCPDCGFTRPCMADLASENK